MKKVLVVIAVAILTVGAAQAQFKFGVRAGLNLTNQKLSSSGISISPDSKAGFQIGVVGDLSVSDALAIQPGIVFATLGCKLGDTKTSLNYIQVPINVQYKFDLGSVQLFPQAGPYLGFAIGGKYKEDGESMDLKIGNDELEDDYKAFDFGLGIGAGIQFAKSFQAVVGYNFGLINIDPAGGSDYKVKNNGLAITLTYLFGK
jgi:hypothetical protein